MDVLLPLMICDAKVC